MSKDTVQNAPDFDIVEARMRLDASSIAVGNAWKSRDAADFNRILNGKEARQNFLNNFHLAVAVRSLTKPLSKDKDALEKHYAELGAAFDLSPVVFEQFLLHGVITYANACIIAAKLEIGLGRMLYEVLSHETMVREGLELLASA